MGKRSYDQYCPIAYGLDVIGERWTLLVVRELGLGPRRFTDLQRGLPGMSPNLLSRRLKALEAAGILTLVMQPPPAGVPAYTLTESGIELLRALGPLVRWGLRFMPEGLPEDDFIGAIPALSTLRVLYRPTLVAGEHLSAEITLTPDVFRIDARPNGLTVGQGFDALAQLAFTTDPRTLIALALGTIAPDVAPLTLTRGAAADLHRLLGQFDGAALAGAIRPQGGFR